MYFFYVNLGKVVFMGKLVVYLIILGLVVRLSNDVMKFKVKLIFFDRIEKFEIKGWCKDFVYIFFYFVDFWEKKF